MSMDRHNGVSKSRTMTTCLSLLLLAATAGGYAQTPLTTSNCGGEGDPACGPNDPAYSANDDIFFESHPMECDYGLVKTSDNSCQPNYYRKHLADTNTTTLGRQILAQEYSIGADTPINWLSILGTHNSFSNSSEGAVSGLVVDQTLSITDQLQAGARTIMLDVHYYDGQMRLCHDSTTISGFTCPYGQHGRLFLFAIKEIAHWLQTNPGEFLLVRINHTVDDDYDYLLDGPIQAYLGAMVFTRANFNGNKWPTLRELRADGKRIAIIGSNSTPWIHSWGQYALNDAQPNGTGLNLCENNDGVDVRTRKNYQFAYISEDRSLSGDLGDLDAYLFPLLDACGFSIMDVDFLDSLSNAALHPAKDDNDDRPQASVWSLAPGVEPETQSPMVMSGLKMQPGQKTDLHPFACAGPGTGADQGAFPPLLFPGNHPWKFTQAEDIWKNGEAACQKEFGPTYHFWAPATGIEYGGLADAYYASWLGFSHVGLGLPFWVNLFGGPVLTGTPNVLTFKWNKTQAWPSAQSMIYRGGRGGNLLVLPDDPAPNQQALLTYDNIAMVNPNTASISINRQLVSSLPIGTYTQSLRVQEIDPATGQTNITRFPVTLQVTDTLLVSPSLVTLGNCTGLLSANVFIKSGGDFTLEPSDSWLHVTADGSTAPARLVITADPTGLLSGLHSGYVKVVASRATNGGAVIQVNLTVSPQTTVSFAPAVAPLSVTVDGITVTGSRTFCWASGTTHTVSAPSTETLGTGSRATFLAWSDGGSATHTFIQPGAADDLVANFNVQYRVAATVNNPSYGSVVVWPSSADGYYNLGTVVSFTAKPRPGRSFSDIVLNGTPTSTNPLVPQVTVPVNVVAEFH